MANFNPRMRITVDDEVIEFQALITEREAMIAENIQRCSLNQSIAYIDRDFFIIAEKMRKLKEEKVCRG